MKDLKNKAFTLIETVTLVIGVIAVGAMYFAYQYFNNTYQSITDRAAMSKQKLSIINCKRFRNAGYKNINYSRSTWDRKIEVKNNYNSRADYLSIWFNSDQNTRIQAEYYIEQTGNQTNLVKQLIENPVVAPKKAYCERYSNQRNCKPMIIVENVTDFQVVLRDNTGAELTSVGLSSAEAIANQDKVHTAEIYVTVRSPNELTKLVNNEDIKSQFSMQKTINIIEKHFI